MASTWASRRSGYKLGVLVLFLGSAFYLVGFACPFWFDGESNGFRVFYGLWMSCSEYSDSDEVYVRHSECQTLVGGKVNWHWFKAMQGMESVGLIFLVMASVYALVVNCCRTSTGSHCRWLELLAAFGGVCGFVGCMVFVGEMVRLLDDPLEEDQLSWAFGLSLAGSILSFISAVTIFVNNRAHSDTALLPPGTFIFAGAAPLPPAPAGSPQGEAYPAPGKSYPRQSWMGYVAPPPPYSGGDEVKTGPPPEYSPAGAE